MRVLMIKKKRTEFRANLEISKSLDFIMVIKMNSLEELIPSYKMEVIKWNFHANCWKVVTQHAGNITKNVKVTKIKWKQASRGVFRKRCSV